MFKKKKKIDVVVGKNKVSSVVISDIKSPVDVFQKDHDISDLCLVFHSPSISFPICNHSENLQTLLPNLSRIDTYRPYFEIVKKSDEEAKMVSIQLSNVANENKKVSITTSLQSTYGDLLNAISERLDGVETALISLYFSSSSVPPQLISASSSSSVENLLNSWKKVRGGIDTIAFHWNVSKINLPRKISQFLSKISSSTEDLPDLEFNIFNRRIMDVVVEANEMFLESYGFHIGSSPTLNEANSNMEILNRIKEESSSSSTLTGVFNSSLIKCIKDLIRNYLDLRIKRIVESDPFRGAEPSLDGLKEYASAINTEEMDEAEVERINRVIKDFDSLVEILENDQKILELIQQDFSVYFFHTKNDLEMASMGSRNREFETTTFPFIPIKQGFLALRMFSGKRFGSSYISYCVLSQRFFIMFVNPQERDNLGKIFTTSQEILYLPLSLVEVTDKYVKGEEIWFILKAAESKFKISSSSVSNMTEWTSSIEIMRSKHKEVINVFKVNKSSRYAYNVKVLGESSNKIDIEVESFGSSWKLSVSITRILSFLREVNAAFNNLLILPDLQKHPLFKEYSLHYIKGTLFDLLIDWRINQSEIVAEFFEVSSVFRAIQMKNLEMFKYNLTEDLDVDSTRDGMNIIHTAIIHTDKSFVEPILEKFPLAVKQVTPDTKLTTLMLSVIQDKREIFDLLLARTIFDISVVNSDGENVFILACKRSDDYYMKRLLDLGQDVDPLKKDSEGNNAFFTCIEHSNSRGFFLLSEFFGLKRYGREILYNAKGESMLVRSMTNKLEDVAIFLFEYFDFLEVDSSQKSLLHHAAINSLDNAVQAILKHTGKKLVNLKDSAGNTALHYAMENRGATKIIAALIESGSDLYALNDDTSTVLNYGVMHNNIEGIVFLREFLNDETVKVLIKQRDTMGRSPLENAIIQGHTDIVSNLIILYGAPLSVPNEATGQYPIHLASTESRPDIINVLLQNGADIDRLDDIRKETALYSAVRSRIAETCSFLIEKGADVNFVRRKDERSVLMCAVSVKSEEMVKMLCQGGAMVNYQDKSGNTALHIALREKLESIAVILVENGSYLHLINNEYESAISYVKTSKLKKRLRTAATKYINSQKSGGKLSEAELVSEDLGEAMPTKKPEEQWIESSLAEFGKDRVVSVPVVFGIPMVNRRHDFWDVAYLVDLDARRKNERIGSFLSEFLRRHDATESRILLGTRQNEWIIHTSETVEFAINNVVSIHALTEDAFRDLFKDL